MTAFQKLRESMESTPGILRLEKSLGLVRLYHGTTRAAADILLRDGWKPGSGSVGGQMGQNRYLYLTTTPENALWYAQEKGDEVVLEIRADIGPTTLRVDPEDGTYDTVEEELAGKGGMPGNVVAITDIRPESIREYKGPINL